MGVLGGGAPISSGGGSRERQPPCGAERLNGSYAAYIQQINGSYTAYIQPTNGSYAAYIQWFRRLCRIHIIH